MEELIERELANVRKKYNDVDGAELISCVRVMVQVKITRTEKKQLTACFMFPEEGYPRLPIILELKSKVMPDKLLNGLSKLCDEQCKSLTGQQQILTLCKFIRKFIDDTPLCVCTEEIQHIKRNLISEQDEVKLKQKTSQVILKMKEREYMLTVKIFVPDNYPFDRVQIEIGEQNFPNLLKLNFTTQAEEIARQCVEAPLKKKPKDPPFEPKPSLRPVCEYLISDVIRAYPTTTCPCCAKSSLPDNPKNVITDPADPNFLDRVYCKHLFHHGCLEAYMSIPPFTGGKKCPTCGLRIFHERFKATPQVAEARWAHKEARRRELDEVVDFLG